jgi:hypothetical protein
MFEAGGQACTRSSSLTAARTPDASCDACLLTRLPARPALVQRTLWQALHLTPLCLQSTRCVRACCCLCGLHKQLPATLTSASAAAVRWHPVVLH